jgi:hypothetical protein
VIASLRGELRLNQVQYYCFRSVNLVGNKLNNTIFNFRNEDTVTRRSQNRALQPTRQKANTNTTQSLLQEHTKYLSEDKGRQGER